MPPGQRKEAITKFNLRLIYAVLGWGMVALGIVNMSATPRVPTWAALWFFSGGIAMALTGGINLLNRRYSGRVASVRWFCIGANAVMTILSLAAGLIDRAGVSELAVIVSWMLATTIVSMLAQARPNRTGPVRAATHVVVVRLDPKAMAQPDLDVRWNIEKILRQKYPYIDFFDDGYGFGKKSEAMFLAYATTDPDRLTEAFVDLLTNETFAGNQLAKAAMVAVGPRRPVEPGEEFAGLPIVFPPAHAGKALPD